MRTNVRVHYSAEIPATGSLIEAIAEAHNGIWWCGGNLSEVELESNFAFHSREAAYGFMLRVNCLMTAYAVIDLEQVKEVN